MDVRHFYGEHHYNTTVTPCPIDQGLWCNNVPQWFHGVTSRKAAETLLLGKPPGYFLVRVGESRHGYTLSYRATDRCRHFMIDEMRDGNFTITGECTRHRTLQDLVDFHSRNPFMPFNELLTVPCRQVNTATPTALPRQRDIYNTTTTATQAHLAPDIPAEVPRLLETNDNNNFLYPTLPTSTLSTSGTTTVSTPEQSARQDENDSGGDTKPSAALSHTELMAMFRKKRVVLQESPQSVEGSLSSGAGRPVDEVLPQEYGLPPPYAPGYY
ncbi:hypothetical protein CRUP_020472 [Coryphaenoides rupestris]|nr:hypothetical protein CRUP_020472 [Coryphaenoides rupestris]